MAMATRMFHFIGLKCIALLLLPIVVCSGSALAQGTAQPSQEIINQRIAAIFQKALAQDVGTTPEGYRVTSGRIGCTLEETEEIQRYGERAITPLSEFLSADDHRVQALAIRLLEMIGGPHVFNILTNVMEHGQSSASRYSALLCLQGHPWPEIADVVRRLAANDPDRDVKSRAQQILQEHEPPAPDTAPISQETINQRIAEIFKEVLPIGTERTAEGYSESDYGRVFWTPLQAAEIKKYGEKTIPPLSDYLTSNDLRTRQLAIQFLNMIRGPRVLKILADVAQRDQSPINRSTALAYLGQYSWPDIADAVTRIAANDDDATIKSHAQEMMQSHVTAQ